MEFEQLKNTWQDLGKTVGDEHKVIQEKIDKVIRRKYRARLNRVLLPKALLTIGCLYFALMFTFWMDTFDTAFLKTLGMFSIVFLLLLPSLSFYVLYKLYRLGQPDLAHAEVIERFTRQKIRFHRLQQLNGGIGFLLIIAIIVLSTKIYNEYDVTQSKYFWATCYTISFLFVGIFYQWIIKRYNRSIAHAEQLLKELKEENK